MRPPGGAKPRGASGRRSGARARRAARGLADDLELREAASVGAAGRPPPARRSRPGRPPRAGRGRRRSSAGRRRSASSIAFERPPRRISTRAGAADAGLGGDTTSRIALSRSAAGASTLWRAAGTGAAATSAGSHTSQHGPGGAGSVRSPKWRRIPRRRQAPPSTHAQTERYWRQRTRVPSCVGRLQIASVVRSHAPTTPPDDPVRRRRRGLDHARTREVADDRAHRFLLAPPRRAR